ncbi:hypothetical protein K439DRAFT_1364015 [Ramaria rubella]|nr:hypothetical protein K439DRAFT_1364015 [Ramaria rubella]
MNAFLTLIDQQTKSHAITDSTSPLCMLITGPGGTGKTHVVRALNTLMSEYGCGHTICYLAPTGSAAALIDRTTIHKGLSISIVTKGRGKGNRGW